MTITLLHYIFLCGFLPGILPYKSIYFEKHSSASMTEIGALLAALPILLAVLRPLVCARAEKHKAHKLYLMIALTLMALGYGSLTVAPLLPKHISSRYERLVWYTDVNGVLLGYGALAVIWSLGDALAEKSALEAGSSKDSWRRWALLAWGVSGSIGSQVNELHQLNEGKFLPRYVPAVFLLVFLLIGELAVVAFSWPGSKDFVVHREETSKQDKSSSSASDAQVDYSQASIKKSITMIRTVKSSRLSAYVLIFVLLGFIISSHNVYVYAHVERLCRITGPRFSIMTTGLMMAHSLAEVGTLKLLLPQLRNIYYAIYLQRLSLFYAKPVEMIHGIISALVYTLLKDVAREIADNYCHLQPLACENDRMKSGTAESHITLRSSEVQNLLACSMDALGGSMGALVGGVLLDQFNFSSLWLLCAAINLLVIVLLYAVALVTKENSNLKLEASSQHTDAPNPICANQDKVNV